MVIMCESSFKVFHFTNECSIFVHIVQILLALNLPQAFKRHSSHGEETCVFHNGLNIAYAERNVVSFRILCGVKSVQCTIFYLFASSRKDMLFVRLLVRNSSRHFGSHKYLFWYIRFSNGIEINFDRITVEYIITKSLLNFRITNLSCIPKRQ